MRSIRILAIALSVSALACSSESITAVQEKAPPVEGPELSRSTTLSGLVVLYPEKTCLFSEGREVHLVGATDSLVYLGGREVAVVGRFIASDTFFVEWVATSGPSV